MSINAISNSNVSNFYSNATNLTPEGLLLYCQTALGSLDSDVKSLLDEQKLNLVRKAAISNCENVLKKYGAIQSDHQVQWDEYCNTFRNAVDSLPPGDPVRVQIQGLYDQEAGKARSKEQWSAYTGEMHSILENVNGNAEINMIQLQSLMSQRQTAVNLSTNLLQKCDETTKSIVNNMGR